MKVKIYNIGGKTNNLTLFIKNVISTDESIAIQKTMCIFAASFQRFLF